MATETETQDSENRFSRTRMRDAEFIKPPNLIKAKVGAGGLNDEVLNRTQKLLESHATDFTPLAEMYLKQMQAGIKEISKSFEGNRNEIADEIQIALILYPCVQLKANGSMFHYPLITRLAAIFVQFMEVVERVDEEIIDIAQAFHTTLSVVISGKITSDGGTHAEALEKELSSACHRYFEKHKEYIENKKSAED